MKINLDINSIEDYERFLKIKSLPRFSFTGRTAQFPDEYASQIGMDAASVRPTDYRPLPGLFDYQKAISKMAIEKGKFAIFADCGLGKCNMEFEFAKHSARVIPKGQCVLIVAPLMVVDQALEEREKFYGNSLKIKQVRAHELSSWLTSGKDAIGITNYDALTDETPQGRLGSLILDESSMLKSHYGKWGQTCIRLGKGLRWKLAATGTPAPNDQIEFANHAVFLDAFPTVNSFLARFFVNRGETQNRWELKPHALRPFYRALSHWSIFLTNPAVYGWKDNTNTIPPMHVHIHDVPLTTEQQELAYQKTGKLFMNEPGGITSRSVLSQIAKGSHKGEAVETFKPQFIRDLADSFADESCIIWCKYNSEQEIIAAMFPEAANISGDTRVYERRRLIALFKSGEKKILISKPKILGFGLNLQIATRQIFSGLQDSYEEFYQAVKRSNRIGSTRALQVHIPITDIERPMVDTVLAKANRVQSDTEAQEKEFFNAAHGK